MANPQSWRPVQTKDYLTLGGLVVSTFAISSVETEDHPSFNDVVIDSEIRNFFRFKSREAREEIEKLSDLTVGLAVAMPIVFTFTPNQSYAQRVTVTSLQTLAFTGFWQIAAKHLVKRPRPYNQECAVNGDYERDCQRDDSQRSFFSGHSAMSFTSAGLVCYFQNEFLNSPQLCAPSILLASTVATLRVMADKHYFSDVLIGGILGWTSGFYLPNFLHRPNSFFTLMPLEHGTGIILTTTY